ncbi:hypothetical protein [Tardiphaga sp.]|uniref:hypothetical protein n=1 Tax=Tardiphaga sp. TaxID=1926292 RepID=UPI00352B2372
MDQQQKPNDNPVETIAKTVPGEFISLVILLKTFLSDNANSLIFIGIGLVVLLPTYARRVLKIDSMPQIALMIVSYLAWFLLLVPDEADKVLQDTFHRTLSFKSNISTFAAVVLVFQFAVPFLTKPQAAQPPAPPAPVPPVVPPAPPPPVAPGH